MDHRAKLRCKVTGTSEDQMRAFTAMQDTTVALAIRLYLPKSFREKYRQLVGISSTKKALESALFRIH
jgi:hypothetical protein